MKNERLRNRDLIAMKLRGGKGTHGGSKRRRNRKERKAIRNNLARGEE